jgi:Xaa-Pro aminopeptidase
VTDVLIHADTIRSPELRHEVPVAVPDAFLYFERNGSKLAMVSSFEVDRLREVGVDAQPYEVFGWDELVAKGMPREEVDLELAIRAAKEWGVSSAAVPSTFPLELADRLRASGTELTVDRDLFLQRRRVKTEAELAGIRRALRAAEAGMAAAEELIRGARRSGGRLHHDGEPLTAERIQAEVRAAFDRHGSAAVDNIVAPGAQGATCHDPGSGPIAAGTPVIVDLWPQDRRSGCWADMTRTFVHGDPADDVVRWAELCREATSRVLDRLAPGTTGEALWAAACEVFEAAGEPTRRRPLDRPQPLRDGFIHSLGHGVGLEVHEAPLLGIGGEPLVAGDVVTIEPGLYREGYGGVRLEDMYLVTDDGHERLTSYPDALVP